MTTPITLFPLPALPDPADRSLAAACAGDVRGQAFAAAEQVLRMLASFQEGTLRAAVRLTFTPGDDRQGRTRIELALASDAPASAETIHRLGPGGPLGLAYDFGEAQEAESWRLPPDLSACCEVVRREDAWKPDPVRREKNPYVPPVYYDLTPFEGKDDNDWVLVDRLFDGFREPAVVEVAVASAEETRERMWHYRYVTQLMQVNQSADDLNPDAVRLPHGAGGPALAKLRDPMADEILRGQEEVHRKLREPHLVFSVRCWAARRDDALVLAASVAESCLGAGKYRLLPIEGSDAARADVWAALRAASEAARPCTELLHPEVWGLAETRELKGPRRLSHMGTVEELKGFFRLPVGSPGSSPRTMRRHTDPKPVRDAARSILVGDDLELGLPRDRTWPDDLDGVFSGAVPGHAELRIDAELLKKHVFVAGVPGSGKTTAMNNFIAQLAHLSPPVPFLVIEPAKTEYRTFKELRTHPDPVISDLARELRVFSVGNETISPFRFNPLAYPDGIEHDEHLGSVMTCFEAAMPMGGPLKALLANALDEVYARPPEGARFPRLKDLVAASARIIESKSYDAEVKGNLVAQLEVRLGLLVRRSVGKIFDCDEGIPPQELFEKNVILEMDYLSQEHACLMTLLVLSSLREHIRVTRKSGQKLHHVTILEEAHNIVGRTGEAKGGEDSTDPKAFAAQFVARMLAELRAMGEGMIVADQLPSAVAPEVVKNTGAKLAHRLVANEDREDLGGTMLLDEAGQEELARLQPGEAFLYAEGLYRPRRVRALGSHVYLALGQPAEPGKRPEMPQPPSRERLVELMGEEEWYQRARAERRRQDLLAFRQAMESLGAEIGKGRRVLKTARDCREDYLAEPDRGERGKLRSANLAELEREKNRLLGLGRAIQADADRVVAVRAEDDEEILEFSATVERECTEGPMADFDSLQDDFDALIEECRAD